MARVTDFLALLLAQEGKDYEYGVEVSPADTDPAAFDCSELVEWACRQLGVKMPDGSRNQWDYCHRRGTAISVEEGLKTPGALLFRFVNGNHVAVSLGDGYTIEARGAKHGVGRFPATGRVWTHAALIPGLTYAEG